MSDVSIENVKMVIGGQEINLTLKQAKDLKKVLDELFPEKPAKEFIPVPYPRPYPVYPRLEPWLSRERQWEITCDASQRSATLCLASNSEG